MYCTCAIYIALNDQLFALPILLDTVLFFLSFPVLFLKFLSMAINLLNHNAEYLIIFGIYQYHLSLAIKALPSIMIKTDLNCTLHSFSIHTTYPHQK